MGATSSEQAIEAIVRDQWGRLLAILAVQFRDLDFAEDALQEGVVRAVASWPDRGVPENPAAWLLTTARRIAIDDIRRTQTFERMRLLLESDILFATYDATIELDDDIPDERLRLIFTCCHPALNRDARVILTLRTLGGLTTSDIARALLQAEPTIGQRISRAKRKIRDAGIPFQTPHLADLPERLDAVLNVLYLIYNEGYLASGGELVDRPDLAAEAVRLTRMIQTLLPGEPEVTGLLALMLLNQARRPARIDARGQLVTLAEQDRSQWDRAMLAEGTAMLESALLKRRAGPYQLQAAISAVHCDAPSSEATDWSQIVSLYDLLLRMTPSPIVELNRAIALAEASGTEAGLAAVDAIQGREDLDGYRFLHSSRADLLRRLNRTEEAIAAYHRALDLTENDAERAFLLGRLESLSNG